MQQQGRNAAIRYNKAEKAATQRKNKFNGIKGEQKSKFFHIKLTSAYLALNPRLEAASDCLRDV